ncbi:hypothetical protein L6164_024410 [Bauhinia variegata]|uniref:Uncharacterized protein n=1 Tax=Bauhinia variegata TaxID=167791 RepID=A0ACB9LXP6_BAUVA|nr:hypothetical protein L6164_024410 [Bauhinia variegata]
MRTISSPNTPSSSLAPTASLTSAQPSPWHSPVPYLFGGLAAMLGLIAFALLILACSYWKLSGSLRNENGDRDLEGGDGQKDGDSANKESVKVYEEKILVIMAGDVKPTYLATPVCATFSSFPDGIGKTDDKEVENGENCEKPEKQVDTQVQATTHRGNENDPETQQQNQ